MKYIELSKGHQAIVDDDDFEYLNRWKWHLGGSGYAIRMSPRPNRYIIQMHRIINNTPVNMKTDHINGDKLDNRRVNLRSCTQSQNLMNKHTQRNNTSGIIGVGWHKHAQKWRAYISDNGKHRNLGYFQTKEEAEKVYKQAAKELFGEFARTEIR